MFDNAPQDPPAPGSEADRRRLRPEDERIALRCNRRELQLLDSFVASGEFRSRSELMRAALRDFVRRRSAATVAPAPRPSSGELVEVVVRLRPEEAETLRAYGRLVANGAELSDVVAQLARRGELETKVGELVERARRSVRGAAETEAEIRALERSGEDLERKGVVGR
ncbi:MAG TPA: ribbon-helix-helix domain-containing protein [Thermoplasmata archaeon]|nr:ribbon-helix-helix domain-containing protein [Thermoplasmata archaeon]